MATIIAVAFSYQTAFMLFYHDNKYWWIFVLIPGMIVSILSTYFYGTRQRIKDKIIAEHWGEPNDNAGTGGPGPLFTSGLLTQYEIDRIRHNEFLDSLLEDLK